MDENSRAQAALGKKFVITDQPFNLHPSYVAHVAHAHVDVLCLLAVGPQHLCLIFFSLFRMFI